jgi:hypothetical protein
MLGTGTLKNIVIKKNIRNKNKSLEHNKQREITRPFYRLECSETLLDISEAAVSLSVRAVLST